MSSAMDFLRRTDQPPRTTAGPEVAVDHDAARTSNNSPESLSTAELDTPRHIPPRELQADESHAAVNNQKSNDEMNAEKLAELLHSFSFKETTGATDNASGSILETFLMLLAEHTDIPPELEEAKDSCVKQSKIIVGHEDESEKVENVVTIPAKHIQGLSTSRWAGSTHLSA
ncbi:hypothetical protein E4U55_001081 [Claviceps digitariae]|nr:hypothetical protein E4U55_001081 [Claviceps digitariae]